MVLYHRNWLKRHLNDIIYQVQLGTYCMTIMLNVTLRRLRMRHRLERGVITGCTISVILFTIVFNMLIKSTEVECRGPLMKTGVRQPPIRAYIDDLTVTTASVTGCRWLLRGLVRSVSLARMQFKPAKSWSLVIKRGVVVDRFCFGFYNPYSEGETSEKSRKAEQLQHEGHFGHREPY